MSRIDVRRTITSTELHRCTGNRTAILLTDILDLSPYLIASGYAPVVTTCGQSSSEVTKFTNAISYSNCDILFKLWYPMVECVILWLCTESASERSYSVDCTYTSKENIRWSNSIDLSPLTEFCGWNYYVELSILFDFYAIWLSVDFHANFGLVNLLQLTKICNRNVYVNLLIQLIFIPFDLIAVCATKFVKPRDFVVPI